MYLFMSFLIRQAYRFATISEILFQTRRLIKPNKNSISIYRIKGDQARESFDLKRSTLELKGVF